MKRPVLTALKGVETMPNWMAYNSPAAGLGSDRFFTTGIPDGPLLFSGIAPSEVLADEAPS